jgi:protein-arginine kinase
MTSRIRLARNVAGKRFVNSATPDELANIYDICFNAVSKARQFKGGETVRMSEISDLGRGMLIEQKMISRELPSGSPASGVYYSKDNSLSAMINE